jgi:hypothetical protein
MRVKQQKNTRLLGLVGENKEKSLLFVAPKILYGTGLGLGG